MSSMAKRSHDPRSIRKLSNGKQNRQIEFSARRQKIAQQRNSIPIASTAITIAKRVAKECVVEMGQKVGYSIRFDDTISSSTRIKYMTDGLLLREALLDPYLFKYSIIIVDEAHERTVHTDVLLALLKNVQSARSRYVADDQGVNFGKKNVNAGMTLEKEYGGQSNNFLKKDNHKKYAPLKLIIMSASHDARIFSEYFGSAKSVHIQGRQFSVDIFYTCHPKDYLDASLIIIFQMIGSQKLQVVPIFATFPSEQQLWVFAPALSRFRKISVIIPGVKYVIDPGFVKARSYDPRKDMESLIIVPASKSQALQRNYPYNGRTASPRIPEVHPPECSHSPFPTIVVMFIKISNDLL
ncbi:hypothetical protein S83_038493, partial [Arachis hypogaea]